VPSVRHDYCALGRLAAEHLLEKGFQRFGCVIVPGGNFIQDRFRAFSETLRERGLKPQLFHLRTHQPVVPQLITPEERRRFSDWGRNLQAPAAVALMDDWDAPALMAACREAGHEIPRDLVMVSTGCHSEVLPLCPVPLSAAPENQELLGRLAVACLDDLMSGKRLNEFTISASVVRRNCSDKIHRPVSNSSPGNAACQIADDCTKCFAARLANLPQLGASRICAISLFASDAN
jgi:LacI family transcriptional regulator